MIEGLGVGQGIAILYRTAVDNVADGELGYDLTTTLVPLSLAVYAEGDDSGRAYTDVAGQVEILAGLAEGDEIVVSGQFLIDSESNLRASLRRLTE